MTATPSTPRAGDERVVRAETLGAMVAAAVDRHRGPALRLGPGPDAAEWSFAELGVRARELARGLIALGIERGDRVAVLSNTRAEWTLVDCAILLTGAVVVPVYQTSSPEETRYVLEHSGSRAIICENASQLEKVTAVREHLPDLEHVATIEPTADVPSIDDLRARAGEVEPSVLDERLAATSGEDVATIVYTSGTTGPPKGCQLTHDNMVSAVDMYLRTVRPQSSAVFFVFLPLAHVLARIAQMVGIEAGATQVYWSRDMKAIIDDVAAARPTHFPSVPRVFEKIHQKALSGVEEAGGLRKRMFDWAIGVGRRVSAGESGPLLRAQHALADRLVLSKVRGLFGDRLEMALTGAAPIAVEVLEFFDACGVRILEGYGMTETCAAATLNAPDAYRFGTVGRPLPGMEVRIAEDGEVLMRGPNVFKGYYRDPEATAEVLGEDGWLRSGDLGEIDDGGFVRITGRKKDLIITSSGKNITPSNIESALRESRWISQAVVYGDNRPYLVALLTLDPEEVPALARKAGVAPDLKTMARDERVREIVQADVDAANARFARIEQVKRFFILDRDLTLQDDELTPTMKVKRQVVTRRYADEFEAIYD